MWKTLQDEWSTKEYYIVSFRFLIPLQILWIFNAKAFIIVLKNCSGTLNPWLKK